MKKNIQLKIIVSIITIFGFNVLSAQILTNNGLSPLITNSNVLIDGSSNFSTEAGAGPYQGKGIIIPSVDLVNFAFDLTLADGSTFPTYFDGMMVYNNATGSTLITGDRSSTATAVTPGFYYFSNPDGLANSNVTSGVWTALAGSTTISNTNLTGAITTSGNTATLGSFTSSNIATAVTDETGTGSVVLAASPIFSGTPTVPTPLSSDSSLQIANTQFVANAVKTPLAIKTSNYTITSTDYTVLCNASIATFSLTLPAAADSTDKIIIIKKIDSSYNPITFSPNVYLTDSETALSINYPKTIKIQSNGTNWYVIN